MCKRHSSFESSDAPHELLKGVHFRWSEILPWLERLRCLHGLLKSPPEQSGAAAFRTRLLPWWYPGTPLRTVRRSSLRWRPRRQVPWLRQELQKRVPPPWVGFVHPSNCRYIPTVNPSPLSCTPAYRTHLIKGDRRISVAPPNTRRF